nr:leukocyte tyrosine kinase receptor isoform X1 [Microcebus murinus]
MDSRGRLLLWLGAAGTILCSSSGSQVRFPLSSPLPAPSSRDPKVTAPLSGVEPTLPLNPSGTERSWQFSTCGASGRRGPTQAQCDGTYAGSGVAVTVGAAGRLRGVQLWRAPGPGQYLISAYGAAGGKGARNHVSRAHGVFVSAIFSLSRGEPLHILVGQQGEDACPGGSPGSRLVCLGESPAAGEHAATDGTERVPGSRRWAGGGGGGGGATYVFRVGAPRARVALAPSARRWGPSPLPRGARTRSTSVPRGPSNPVLRGEPLPFLGPRDGASRSAGVLPRRLECAPLNAPLAPQLRAGELEPLLVAAGGGGRAYQRQRDRGWAQATPEKLENRPAAPGSGGRGGAAGGNASETDNHWANGEDGVSFIHPSSELYLQPLAVTESHGEVEIRRYLNCSHCPLRDCQWQAELQLAGCLCPEGMVLAVDNITCMDLPTPPGPLVLMVAVVVTLTLSLLVVCGVLILVSQKKWQGLWGMRLPGPELELSKLRTSAIRTAPNPYYCHAGLGPAQSWPLPAGLTEVSPANVTLLRALGHGAFGEVYEGLVVGLPGDSGPLQVAIKTLPELCSRQDELDFLMEALIISKFSHQNIVRCVGLSLQAAPRLILLELMSGGDMKSFLRCSRPHLGQPSPLVMQDLLQLAQDIAQGCHYLEENHFIHRDIAARNCLLSCTGPSRVAKIGDFGMARDIYRASYYRKGDQALLPVKWMPPEAFLEGIFTSKTDSWSFGVLLWEIFSLGYMPYPGCTNQEVLDFVIAGGRMDPPRGCPGPVYRIMTQCWQHQPELRPSFASILERLQYCTQDPDVLNSPLPVELGPTLEEEGASGLGNRSLESPRSPQPQELSPEGVTNWGGSPLGSWLSSGLKPLKSRGLQPQNLWNPTYGSWAPRGPEVKDSGTDDSNGSFLHSSGF